MLEVILQDLFQSFSPLLRAQVFGLVGDPGVVDDVIQETFLTALDHKDSLVLDVERLKGWLIIVARNRAIDHLRRSKRLSALSVETLSNDHDESNPILDRVTIEAAINQLSNNHQQVIREVLVHGTPTVVVATQLGIPAGTVRSRLYYAVKILQSKLEQVSS